MLFDCCVHDYNDSDYSEAINDEEATLPHFGHPRRAPQTLFPPFCTALLQCFFFFLQCPTELASLHLLIYSFKRWSLKSFYI